MEGATILSRNAEETHDCGQRRGHISYASLVLFTVTISVLLVNFVETMVVPGIPIIQTEFLISASDASWITSIVLIVGAAAAPLFGRLGDLHGKKKMFVISLGFYLVGVGVAAIAPSFEVLLIGRGIQGMGFAVLPLGTALIVDAFAKEKVAMAQGVISGMVSVGSAAGLVIGAYMIQDVGWKSAFDIAFVLSILTFILSIKVLKNDVPSQSSKMDYVGTMILTAGIIFILMYMTNAPQTGWVSIANLAILVLGISLTTYFFIYEKRSTHPLINLKLLRIRNVMIANLVGIVASIAMFLTYIAVIYYAQLPEPYGLGMDVISTGLVLAPATLAMLFVAPLVGKIMVKKGPRPVMIVGSIIMIIGFAMFIVERSSPLFLTIDGTVAFIGSVAIMVPMVNMNSVSLPREDVTVGLGFNSMLRNVGGSIGPILAAMILTTFTSAFYITVGGIPVFINLPNATAFNDIYFVGIILGVVIMALSLKIENYVFDDKTSEADCTKGDVMK